MVNEKVNLPKQNSKTKEVEDFELDKTEYVVVEGSHPFSAKEHREYCCVNSQEEFNKAIEHYIRNIGEITGVVYYDPVKHILWITKENNTDNIDINKMEVDILKENVS